MPISKYYKGHGEEVMKSMVEQYGEEKGKEVFYATANKNKKKKAKHHSAEDGDFMMKRAKMFGCMGKLGGKKKC